MKQAEKRECLESLKETIKLFITDEDKANCYPIRFHRLYLDGSYGNMANDRDGGQKIYKLHVNRFSKNLKEETLRKDAISTFKNFVAIEFYNRNYIPRIQEIESILREVLQDKYDAFVDELVINIKDLVS